MILSHGRQSLARGELFNQSMEKVSLPTGLQSIIFGDILHSGQGPQHIFGVQFDQCREQVSLPTGLHSLTVGHESNQSIGKVSLPNGVQPEQ